MPQHKNEFDFVGGQEALAGAQETQKVDFKLEHVQPVLQHFGSGFASDSEENPDVEVQQAGTKPETSQGDFWQMLCQYFDSALKSW